MATEASSPSAPRVGDDVAMATLRRQAHAAGLGVEWSRADDHAVTDFVAWAAPLQAEPGPTSSRLAPKMTVAAAPPAPATSSSRAAVAAAPPPSADPASLRPDLDVPAMVQALQQAARDGVPFCEECARAAAARTAEAAAA